MKNRTTDEGKETTTTKTTPRRTDRARCTRTGRNGCGAERVLAANPLRFRTAVRGYIVCRVCTVIWVNRQSRAQRHQYQPPPRPPEHRRGGSSCETGYDGQTSGYQRVDDDDVTVAAMVEETDGRNRRRRAATDQCSHKPHRWGRARVIIV